MRKVSNQVVLFMKNHHESQTELNKEALTMFKKLTGLCALALFPAVSVCGAENTALEPTACPNDYAKMQVKWECGYLSVPEDYAKPEGKKIKIFVAKAKSRSSTPAADPVLFAGTSIGGKIAEMIPVLFPMYPDFTKDRDFIVYDHRGVGKSIPNLECAEIDEAHAKDFGKDLSIEEHVKHEVDAVDACGKRLRKENNLDVYNTKQTAQDMEAIRKAFGYEKINIFSYSYATYLTLNYMRMYPSNIRSVIMDSAIPADVWLYSNLLAAQVNSLNSVFDNCKADAECNAKYPKLQAAYTEIIKRLDKAPVKLAVQNPHCEEGATCKPVDILVNDNLFSGYIVNELFTANPIPRLPKLLYDTYKEQYSGLIETINAQQAGGHVIGTSWGRYYSTVCHDLVDSENKETIEKAAGMYSWVGLPYYQPAVLGGQIKEICDKWVNTTASEEQDLPVQSDLPVLILQGEYDPYAPPVWGRHISETLPNSYFYVMKGLTHVTVLGEPCPISIDEQFIANPGKEPDTSCIGK